MDSLARDNDSDTWSSTILTGDILLMYITLLTAQFLVQLLA